MGLTIARGIVDAHGGRIEVTSSPGSGTTARVVIPARGPRTLPLSRLGEVGGAAPDRRAPTDHAR